MRTICRVWSRDFGHRENDVKLAHCLIAVLVLGLLATNAAANSRHQAATKDSGHGAKSLGGGQKLDEASGHVKNSTGRAANNNAGTTAGDKGGQNSNRPAESGPMKRGDSLPAKAGSQESGKGSDAGNDQIGDARDHHHRGAIHPGANNGVSDPIRTDNVIVDPPDRKSKKPVVGATKKIIPTTVKPTIGNSNQHPLGLTVVGGGEHNAVGLAVHGDKDPKSGPDGKFAGKGVDAGAQGPEAPKSNAIAAITSIGHSIMSPNVTEDAPKTGAGLNGALIRRPGSGPSTIGGPSKNVASINGTSFRPKRGR